MTLSTEMLECLKYEVTFLFPKQSHIHAAGTSFPRLLPNPLQRKTFKNLKPAELGN